jgi:hypothetical protein
MKCFFYFNALFFSRKKSIHPFLILLLIACGNEMQTKMACPDMRIPNPFTEQLGLVAAWRREGLDLIFLDKNKNEILRFKKK